MATQDSTPAGTPTDEPAAGGADDPRLPHGDEPGASSTVSDDGEGTIGLQDRLGDAAPDTNQARTEPMPPTPAHADPGGVGPHTEPPAVPELGDMNAGQALGQVASPEGLPSRPAASTARHPEAVGPSEGVAASPDGAATHATDAAVGSGQGRPVSQGTGTAQRAPGRQGETPDGESVESDVQAGAARMDAAGRTGTDPDGQPGDAQGVAVPHATPMAGTSEEQGIVDGVKDSAR